MVCVIFGGVCPILSITIGYWLLAIGYWLLAIGEALFCGEHTWLASGELKPGSHRKVARTEISTFLQAQWVKMIT
ncbi:hypothetical protein E4630_21420 [Aeromonas hydrophila]|nr:hypothetical protein E4625_21645 [Aeromonas hydrophila]QBX77902.1 hypothetical protein E4630_21420 [Aeromonas hydrophila]